MCAVTKSTGSGESFKAPEGFYEKLNEQGVHSRRMLEILKADGVDVFDVDFSKLEALSKKTFAHLAFNELNFQCFGQEKINYLFSNVHVFSRFTDIFCAAHTAVKLEGFAMPYLHANAITLDTEGLPKDLEEAAKDFSLRFIVTQAPIELGEFTYWDDRLGGTMPQASQAMFWKAVLKNSHTIIDLTRPTDPVKKYYPDEVSAIKEFSDHGLVITCKQVDEVDYRIKVYQFHIKDTKDDVEKTVYRIHFPDWKDHAGLENLEVLEYIHALEVHIRELCGESLPIMVHCRAGVGRTGTYLVASALMELTEAKILNEQRLMVIVKGLILQCRAQRDLSMVQKPEQLLTILDLGEELCKKGSKAFEIKLIRSDKSVS